jgi:Uri superfamily endonuclease
VVEVKKQDEKIVQNEVNSQKEKYDYEIIISEIDSDSKFTQYLKYNKEICNFGCDEKKCNVKLHFKNFKPESK